MASGPFSSWCIPVCPHLAHSGMRRMCPDPQCCCLALPTVKSCPLHFQPSGQEHGEFLSGPTGHSSELHPQQSARNRWVSWPQRAAGVWRAQKPKQTRIFILNLPHSRSSERYPICLVLQLLVYKMGILGLPWWCSD